MLLTDKEKEQIFAAFVNAEDKDKKITCNKRCARNLPGLRQNLLYYNQKFIPFIALAILLSVRFVKDTLGTKDFICYIREPAHNIKDYATVFYYWRQSAFEIYT